jgi:hypothetical protein
MAASSARIGAMRVRWQRPGQRSRVRLSRLQRVQVFTLGVFAATVAVALLELVAIQVISCTNLNGSCNDTGGVHKTYLGVVVAPTVLVVFFAITRWNARRMRGANEERAWINKQLDSSPPTEKT